MSVELWQVATFLETTERTILNAFDRPPPQQVVAFKSSYRGLANKPNDETIVILNCHSVDDPNAFPF